MESQVYSRQQYATMQFWDSRYKEKVSYFDWYAEYPELKETFQQQYALTKQHTILMLGCGNSKLSQQMYEDGYHHIHNVDISPTVIQQMQKISNEKGYTGMKWEVMDATDMKSIPDSTFDAIIDKGTLDALISGKNMPVCHKMLQQSMRVLKKDGQFILITYGAPQGRKRLFENSIGLNGYDYYFTKVDLSTMSTLINLMRSNLGNKPLHEITKDGEAMKKSFIEFNLLKILRKNRKNEKKFVVWANFKGKQVVLNQDDGKQEEDQSTPKQNSQNNAEKLEVSQAEESKQKVQTVSYNPKKQSYCYVYSIRPKFASDMEHFLASQHTVQNKREDQNGNTIIQGNTQSSLLQIFPSNTLRQLENSVSYLQSQSQQNNSVLIFQSLENFKKGIGESFILQSGEKNVMHILNKTVFEISFSLGLRTIGQVQKLVIAGMRRLVENGGLEAHPSPKNYAYMGILMQKTNWKSMYADFLNKYWYPTFRTSAISSTHVTIQLSVSPTLSPDYCLEQLSQLKPHHVQLLHQGYLSYYNPRIISLLNFCALTYSSGEGILLQLEEFEETKNGGLEGPKIVLKQDIVEKVMARLIYDY